MDAGEWDLSVENILMTLAKQSEIISPTHVYIILNPILVSGMDNRNTAAQQKNKLLYSWIIIFLTLFQHELNIVTIMKGSLLHDFHIIFCSQIIICMRTKVSRK